MRASALAMLGLIALSGPGAAQTLSARIAAVDGSAQVLFPSRPEACGDGRSFTGNLLRRGRTIVDGGVMIDGRQLRDLPCLRGPVRVVATVIAGEITRLRTYIGPVPPADSRVIDLGTVTAREATAWLLELAQRAPARVARSAISPLVAAEGSEPWPQLLAIARSETRPQDVRREAMFWLAEATNQHLGIDTADDTMSDDDDIRQQAVFAISQLPRDVAIPKLLEVARSPKRPAVRKQAIFWLGQSGDARATALFAELLGLR
jgi:hypothetical protein